MQLPNDNRVIMAIGAGLAVLAAVVLALMFSGGRDPPRRRPIETEGPGGLQVDLADAPSLEPTRELRCFVNGQFIGMATLADCARRNGLATDALDVGLDEQRQPRRRPDRRLRPAPDRADRRSRPPTAASTSATTRPCPRSPSRSARAAASRRTRLRVALPAATPARTGASCRPA